MKTEEREHLLKTLGLVNCSTCGSTKDKSQFAKDKSKLLGYSTQCKVCKKEYNRSVKRFEQETCIPSNAGWFTKFKLWLSA